MKSRTHALLPLAALAGLALATSAQAASIAVGEDSFEGAKALGGWTDVVAPPSPGPGPGESTASVPSPWVVSGGQGTGWTDTSQYSGGIPDGDIYAYMNAAGNISQTLAATLQADTTYTLTVATGWRADLPGFGFPTYPGYGIELWAGGVMLASDYDTDAGNSGPALDSWKDVTATYTSPSSVTADPLEIRLIGYGIQTNYDDVRLDGTVVPEPSAVALIGLGGLALLRRRRGK